MTATMTTRRRLCAALAIAATALAAMLMAAALAAPKASASIGIESFDGRILDANGDPATQAGSRPFSSTTEFMIDSTVSPPPFKIVYPFESIKDAAVELPPGLVGNPQSMQRCTLLQFTQPRSGVLAESCPAESQVGYMVLWIGAVPDFFYGPKGHATYFPLYNMEVPKGSPAQFGFQVAGTPAFLTAETRTGKDYGLTILNANDPATLPITGIRAVFWGVPADATHDRERGYDMVLGLSCADPEAAAERCDNPSTAPLAPFLTLPTSCVGPVETRLAADSWETHGEFTEMSFISHDNTEPIPNPIGFDGCNAVEFNPSLEARPTTTVADSPSGLDVLLHIPQHESCDPGPPASCENAEAHLRDAKVTLPEGLVVNPSSANGLDGCSLAEYGYTGTDPDGTIHTTASAAKCPDASKLGTVTVDTPLLGPPLKGSVYLADPHANPFGSLLALYISMEEPNSGTVIKLAGKVTTDPATGQITASFDRNPQLPFEDFSLHFFGGAGGSLRTPATCGTYTTTSLMTPWTAPDSGPPDAPSDSWAITQAPAGGCATSKASLPVAPDLDAGSVSPIAGASIPTVVNLRRADGTQEFSKVTLTLPPGLTGKLAGVQPCSDVALASAAQKTGRDEKSSPSCPAASRIGTMDVAAGAGPAPYNTQGTAYLTGPYKGAPLGMAVVTPAVAGPFDLGTVVVRVALFVDRNTGQITAVSDPIPSILQGIPLDIRTVSLKLDRPDFTRNGTSCAPSAFSGQLATTFGQAAPLQERFQLGECTGLAFKPKLALRLKGSTTRGGHPALRAVLTMPAGGANLAKASVALPRSEFLDQGHIGTICTRVQFAANQCPAASVYGEAQATSPLVDYALAGPVYLRSSNNELPDLVMALKGPAHQPIEIDAVARIDTFKRGIRTTFEGVPDLPVSRVVLSMAGGKKGLLQNSTNICRGTHKATARLDGHNGKTSDLRPVLKNPKCGKQRRNAKRRAAR